MPRGKKFTAEQIIGKLHDAGVRVDEERAGNGDASEEVVKSIPDEY